MTWETTDPAQDGDMEAIKARILNADGSFADGEFLVNADGVDEQDEPVVTALADGRFAIAWENENPLQDGSGDTLKMRVFNADGTAATDEILVNVETTDNRNNPAIATLADGRIIVTWVTGDATQDGSTDAIKARIFELVNRETGTGDDEVFAGENVRDEFEGKGGKDLLFGKQGDDQLDGGKGKDQAFGGKGDDTILGGNGRDDLNGGKGKDKFVFKPDGSFDIVADFQNGKDKLDLSAFGFNKKAKALKKFSEAGTADDD